MENFDQSEEILEVLHSRNDSQSHKVALFDNCNMIGDYDFVMFLMIIFILST